MTQEQKELLIKDLCARLDTNLVCSIYRIDDYGVGYRDEILNGYCKGDIWDEFYFGDDCGIGIDNVSKIKPYLFPLSRLNNLTEEQRKTLKVLCDWNDEEADAQSILVLYQKHFVMKTDVIDWLNENHFDYRGLIEKGLAIDATGKNVY